MVLLNSFEEKIFNTIQNYQLISKNQTVLLALSGGADSTALLILLKKLSNMLGYSLYAMHLNHMLRGKDAECDEQFCIRLCRSLGVKCFVKKIPVMQYASKNRLSVEQAGRNIRYREFFKLSEELKADKIATAHHYDDHIETVLMRIMRGTGIDGLCGIELSRPDGIIRPMLQVHKDEILNYLAENNTSYCIDATNEENEFFRNQVRNIILPAFMQIQPNVKELLYRLSFQAKKIKEDIEENLKQYEKEYELLNDEIRINIQSFNEAKEYLKPYLLRDMLRQLDCLENIEKKHIDGILSMPDTNTIWSLDLPGGIKAKREYDCLIIKDYKAYTNNKPQNFIYSVNRIGETILKALNIKISIRKSEIFEKKAHSVFEKYIDYDKINGNLFVRGRLPSDRLRPLNMKGSVSIKKYFINNKIPKEKRDGICLLCDEKNIIWVIGYALDDRYKVDSQTKNIAKITVSDLEFIECTCTKM
jgi:tRNA(Ile)-lysidine synthase